MGTGSYVLLHLHNSMIWTIFCICISLILYLVVLYLFPTERIILTKIWESRLITIKTLLKERTELCFHKMYHYIIESFSLQVRPDLSDANLVMWLFKTAQASHIIGVDSVNDYYDVSLKRLSLTTD